MSFDRPAAEMWDAIYPRLTGSRPGAFGAVTGRADPQVIRLAVAYALTDGTAVVGEAHLRAALALWAYAERSALWVFGASTGDRLADVLLGELRAAWPDGLSRAALSRALSKNQVVDAHLGVLADQHLAYAVVEPTGGRGRPPQVWYANPTPPAPGISAFLR
jgi:hypothetical protein